MTSTPRPQSFYQPPNLMANRFSSAFFRPPTSRQVFTTSFFDTQSQPEPERTRTESERPSDGNTKAKNIWTQEETDALVLAWCDSFVELESHKNPAAWRKIVEAVNEVGNGKTKDQANKKLRHLKDRYKEAKDKNKRSGSARNLPKYDNIFDEVLGTRSVVQLPEVRESGQGVAVVPVNDEEHQEEEINQENLEVIEPQPKRTKKKKASKSAASKQLVDFLGEMQKQQQESMKQFLDGMKEMEERSKKHTADTLPDVVKMFVDGKNKRRRRDSTSSDNEK
eukprot:gene11445-12639_t